jgi:hypothetical protein
MAEPERLPYAAPVVVTYTSDEILARVGPALADSGPVPS